MNQPFYSDRVNLNNIKLDLSDRASLGATTETTKRIATFYKKMLQGQKRVEPVWLPSGEWKDYNSERSFLYQALVDENIDLADEILKNFWRNKLGLIVKEYCAFEVLAAGNIDRVNFFLSSVLRNSFIWRDLYGFELSRLEPVKNVGNPWGCVIEGVFITPKAVRYHHNAMQIKSLLTACGGSVVCEIGAGYGALCSYLHKEVSGLVYIDFDLPETLVLAAYNLINTFPDKKIFLYGESEFCWENVRSYDIVLVPNYVMPILKNKVSDVTFNSFSFSEMAPEANLCYMQEIFRTTNHYLLHNNMDRSGVINRGFERIPASRFPLSEKQYVMIYKNYDVFHGHFGDYKEFLYKIVS